MTIQIDVKRTGFPVKIGEIELWFDSSIERLAKVFEIRDKVREKEIEIGGKLKRYENLTEETMTYEDSKQILEYKKEFVAMFYDGFFGEGAFEKIYSKYPDMTQLEDLIPILDQAIADKINEQEEERKTLVEKKKNEYLNKKKQKQK